MKSLSSVASVFHLSYVHLRHLVQLYADRNKLGHNDVRLLIADRDWNDLGRALEANTSLMKTSVVGALTDFERDAIQYVIDTMKDQYFDSIRPGEDGIKINEATHQSDLDHAAQDIWNGLVGAGKTPALEHLEGAEIVWRGKWSMEDMDGIKRKFQARIEAAAQEEEKRQSQKALESKSSDSLPR